MNQECNDFNKLINTKKSIFYLDSTENFFENVISNKLNTYSEINNYVDNQVKMGDLRKAFLSVPEFDYLGMKSQIEGLNAQKLANVIDNRLIKFYYEKKNDAKSLAEVIRAKQKFPNEKFDLLISSFPCIIASLRDYADFIPLKKVYLI